MKIGAIYFLLILLAIGMLSCKGKNTKMKVLTFDTMKVVILDLMNAEQWNNFIIIKDTTLRNSKNNLKLYQQVFLVHHVNKDQFYYSYQYYEQHPDRMKILLDSLTTFAERQKSKMKKPPVPSR
jgi:hypothetical protein